MMKRLAEIEKMVRQIKWNVCNTRNEEEILERIKQKREESKQWWDIYYGLRECPVESIPRDALRQYHKAEGEITALYWMLRK